MKLQEALNLLKKTGYLCESGTPAATAFEEYRQKVLNILITRVDQVRAQEIVEYEESELRDYAYRQGWSAEEAAGAVIEWTTPSEEQKEILDFMYNNYDADYARSYGPDPAFDQVSKLAQERFDYSTDIPSDMYEFEILYGKSIDE